jgi:hypothetical protein
MQILLYIDPGSSGYLVQIIIGSVLAVLFFFKSAWMQVKFYAVKVFNLFKKKS